MEVRKPKFLEKPPDDEFQKKPQPRLEPAL